MRKRSETSLNQKMRKLVQRLGEAIHESVSESEQIAGVVQDIRRQGFDVLLMLEATIGLNELAEQQPGSAEEATNVAGGEEQEGPRTFTAQDLHFLRSLRIAVEGEEDDASQA
jgi:uncharacterized protein (UPF0335 family)